MGVHFGSLGNHFGASFLWIQKATLRRRHPSFTAIVFECSEEVRFESLGSNFGANFLWVQKATLGTTSCRPNKIIHPQPLGSAAGGVAPSYVYDVCVYKNIMKFNLQLMIDLLKYVFLCGLTIPFLV